MSYGELPPPMPQNAPPYAGDDNLRTMTLVVHGLNAASLVTGGITSLIAVIIAYVKRDDARGTIYESHLTYAIRTFWISLALGVLGFVLMIVVIGIFVLLLAGVWFIIRAVKALVVLLDGKPISDPTAFI